MNNDNWEIGGKTLTSRMLIGSALYPSPANMEEAIKESEAQIVTVALRRQSAGEGGGNNFWDIIKELNIHVLPNTAGCHSAKEAITTAQMAREVFGTNWIKLEVIGDQYNLQPDPFETVKAAEVLIKEGFEVFPYTTDDLVVAKRLADVGCKILMPWGSPIGSGQGLMNPSNLKAIRKQLFPILVTPLSKSVPLLTVTYSLRTVLLPITTFPFSPLSLICCGGLPITQPSYIRQFFPISTLWYIETLLPILVPLPIFMFPLSMEKAPISTSSSSSILPSNIAVGWIFAILRF